MFLTDENTKMEITNITANKFLIFNFSSSGLSIVLSLTILVDDKI